MLTVLLYVLVKLVFLQIYPAYMCFKSIKVRDAQLKPLLIYWIVTSVYLVMEYIADIFLFWFPFYYEVKLLIVLWLIVPQTNGTGLVYKDYLEPFLKTNEPMIDHTVIDIQRHVKDKITIYGKQVIHLLRTFISDSLFKSSEGTQEPGTTTTATATTKVVSDQKKEDSWSPYNIFAALMVATQRQEQEEVSSSSSTSTSAAGAVSSSSSSDPDHACIVERADSYDSLASMVGNGKKQQPSDITSDTTTDTTSIHSTTTTATAATAATATWSGYVSSWIWKSQVPSSTSKTTKQD